MGQHKCPGVVINSIDPHSYPFSAGLLGGIDKDPWDHYLRIQYTNRADKATLAIKFGVYFMGAMQDA
ncbi:MAG: hypothetical protein WBS19_04485, partial [Candidatus Korobacteraceae bacterium]